MKSSRLFVLVTIFIFLTSGFLSAENTRLIFEHSLSNDNGKGFSTIENLNGKFDANGWQSTDPDITNGSKLKITFNDRLPQVGTIEWTIRNFDPYNQSDYSRHHVALVTSTEDFDRRFYENGSWLYLRTGESYRKPDGSCSFRIDCSPMGVDRRSQPHILDWKKWDKNASYRFKIEYDLYQLRFYIDDQLIRKVDFEGQSQRFKYLYLSGDPTYPSLVGPIYSNLKVYTTNTEIIYSDKTGSLNLEGLGYPDFAGHGLTVGDVNGDGLEDIYVGNCSQGKCLRDILYIQQPDGTFTDETLERGVADECCTHGVIFFDADNDGDLDLFNANTWEPNQLYINDGNGYFTEESFSRGIEDIDGETRGAVVFDANNDGWLDIFAANWGMQNELYINDGTGHFTREYWGAEGAIEDVETIGTQGVTVSDIDNDGDYDLYICKREKANELYINENGRFREAASERGVDVGRRSDGATFADIDNDGDMDLFVANSRQPDYKGDMLLHIFVNNGNGYFTDKTTDYDIAMEGYTAQLFDADNDGYLDLFRLRNTVYNPTACTVLNINDGQGQFRSAGYCGAALIASDSRGCLVRDVDHDGDMDMYITTKNFENIYLENETPQTGHYIQISTKGPAGDTGGVGSKIDVYEDGYLGHPTRLLGHREVTTAVGYLSGSGLVQHFGLGQRSFCDVRITLVDGTVIEREHVAANQRIEIALQQDFTQLRAVSGDNQSGYINQKLQQPLVVCLTDQDDNPVSDETITFVVTEGDATIEGSASVQTNVDGEASATVVLGNAPGSVTIEVRHETAKNSPVVFTAIAQVPDIALNKVSGDQQTGQVGEQLPQPVSVVAQYTTGQPVAGENIVFTIKSGGGNFAGDTTTSVATDAQGKAAAYWILGPNLGQQTCHAELNGLAVEFQATALTGDPHQIKEISGDGQNVQPGVAFADSFKVQIVDRFDHPVRNHPVSFQITNGNGILNDNGQFFGQVTNHSGYASVSWTPDAYKGPANTLQASSSFNDNPLQNSPVTWHFPEIDVDPQKSSITATSPVPADGITESEIVVTLRNSDNEPAGSGLTVKLSADGTGHTFRSPDSTTDENGQILAFLKSTVPGTKRITAIVTGLFLTLNQQAEVVFESTEQVAERLVYVDGNNQAATVNSTIATPLQVKVLDTNDLPVPNYPVEYVVTQGDASINGGTSFIDTTAATGIAQAVVTLGRKSGTVHVEARAEELDNSPIQFTIEARPGEARNVSIISGNNQEGTAGQKLINPLVVQVADVYANPIPEYPVQFRTKSGDSHFDGSSSTVVQSDSAGHASAAVTLGQAAGTHKIEAKTSFASVIFTLIVHEPRLPDVAKSGLRATSPVLPDGLDRSEITVTIRDQHGEVLPGVGVRVNATGANNVLVQPDSITDSEGKTRAYLSATTEGDRLVMAYIIPDNRVVEEKAVVSFSWGEPELFMISGNAQTGTVGEYAPSPLAVKLSSNNRPLANQKVTFSVVEGGGAFDGKPSVETITDSAGLASVQYKIGKKAGLNRVKVSSEITQGEKSFEIYGNSGEPASLVKLAGDGQNVRTLSVLPETLKVAVHDKFANCIAHEKVTFTAIDGGQIITSQPVLSDSLGRAVTQAAVGKRSGDYTFRAQTDNGAMALFRATAMEQNSAPQILSFFPQDTDLHVNYGERVIFKIIEAADMDEDPLFYSWLLNGRQVSQKTTFELFLSQAFPNQNTVTCLVTDHRDTTSVTWNMTVNPTKVELSSFTANYDRENGIIVQWHVAQHNDTKAFRLWQSKTENRNDAAVIRQVGRKSAKEARYSIQQDENITPGTYFYWLEDIAHNGHTTMHGPVQVTVTAPEHFVLYQNFPNPFNPLTTIVFDCPKTQPVSLIVFNQNGQIIRTLKTGTVKAGVHRVIWDARDEHGNVVPSGVYFVNLRAENFHQTRKILLMK